MGRLEPSSFNPGRFWKLLTDQLACGEASKCIREPGGWIPARVSGRVPRGRREIIRSGESARALVHFAGGHNRERVRQQRVFAGDIDANSGWRDPRHPRGSVG